MVIDKFFVGSWAVIILFCFACWAAAFVGMTALLRALGV